MRSSYVWRKKVTEPVAWGVDTSAPTSQLALCSGLRSGLPTISGLFGNWSWIFGALYARPAAARTVIAPGTTSSTAVARGTTAGATPRNFSIRDPANTERRSAKRACASAKPATLGREIDCEAGPKSPLDETSSHSRSHCPPYETVIAGRPRGRPVTVPTYRAVLRFSREW